MDNNYNQNNPYSIGQQPQGMNNQNMNLQSTSGICKLTLTRPSSFVGSLWNLKVYLDGEKKCIIKNGETVTLDVTVGTHHISFSGYSDYTLQVLSDSTANVIPTDSKQILLQDLVGANIIEDENNQSSKNSLIISNLVVASSLILLLIGAFFSGFMNSITLLLFIIFVDMAGALVGLYLTNKNKDKLGYSFKKVMYDYIGAIAINILNIIACVLIKVI